MPQSNLTQRLAEHKARQAAEAGRKAQEAVANDIYRRRSEEMAESMARKMAASYQASLESALTGLMDEVAKGMGRLEGLLAAVDVSPSVDLSSVSEAISDIKSEIQNIEIPAPVASTLPPSSPEATGAREPADYNFDVIRDENGFIQNVKDRVMGKGD